MPVKGTSQKLAMHSGQIYYVLLLTNARLDMLKECQSFMKHIRNPHAWHILQERDVLCGVVSKGTMLCTLMGSLRAVFLQEMRRMVPKEREV